MVNRSSISRKVLVLMMAFAVMFTYSVVPMNQAFAASKKPAKVKSLKAKAVSSSAVKLTWKKAKNAKKYQIYVATKKKGKFKKVATVKASKKNYTVKKFNKKALKANTKYYFKVRALNGKKKGKFSKVVSAKTKNAAAPTPAPAKIDYVNLSDEEWSKLGVKEIATDDYIIDVRPAANFEIGHLDGSVNVAVSNPYTAEQATAIKNEFDKANGKRVVLICFTGNKLAKNAMAALQEKGADMSKVTYLVGGANNTAWKMDTWKGKYTSMTNGSKEWVDLGIDYAALSYADDYVIDVRPAADTHYPAGHIVGSVSIPDPATKYAEVNKAALKAEYDKANGKRVVIVCVTGNALARNAFQALAESGADMSKVTYLKGGAKGLIEGANKDYVNNLGIKDSAIDMNTDVIVDLRNDAGYGSGHFKGSLRAIIQGSTADAVASNLDAAYAEVKGEKTRLVLVCVKGHGLAKQAMAYYQKKGVDLTKITYLIGGATEGVSDETKANSGKWEVSAL